MADTGKRFTEAEILQLTKTGALDFVAAMLGQKTASDVEWITSKNGTKRVKAVYTVEGRRAIEANLGKLGAENFALAQKVGFAQVLASALGHHNREGITDTHVLERWAGVEVPKARAAVVSKAPVKVEAVEAAAPAARFHSHDDRKSHRATQQHRG